MIRSKASPEFHNEPQHATACRSWDLVPRFVKVVNDPDRILDEEQARHCDSATMQQPSTACIHTTYTRYSTAVTESAETGFQEKVLGHIGTMHQ